MKPIGWTLTCLLLALFSKNVLSDDDPILGERRFNLIEKNGESTITRLTPVSKMSTTVDRDVLDLREFMEEIFVGNGTEGEKGVEASSARTFGVKRLQLMLMPMMYKMGVMMTLLTVLTVISLKGLLIGVILLVLKLSTFFAKFYAGWNQHQAPHSWSPQPIHVHVHNDLPYAHGQAYHGWEPASGPTDEEHYYYKG